MLTRMWEEQAVFTLLFSPNDSDGCRRRSACGAGAGLETDAGPWVWVWRVGSQIRTQSGTVSKTETGTGMGTGTGRSVGKTSPHQPWSWTEESWPRGSVRGSPLCSETSVLLSVPNST